VNLNHVTLPSTDLARSVAYYSALGLTQIVANPPTYARFACPAGDSTLSLLALGDDAEMPRQLSSVHFECEALDAKVDELKAKGFAFDQDPTDQPYLWREAILRDPDGNVLFLFHAGENRLNPPWRI
jgi:catechol 2,3-dioxygenase-like lactoylglutathione lyase family enzyme